MNKRFRELKTNNSGLFSKQTETDYYFYSDYSSEIKMPVIKVSDIIQENNSQANKKDKFVAQKTIETEYIQNEKFIKEENIINIKIQEYEEVKLIPKIDINAQAYARKIADSIEDEVRKFWTRKNFVRKRIKEINVRNAYSFIGYMITISNTGSVLGDIKKYITYTELKHLIFCLLRQAKSAGLVDLEQYKILRKEYDEITKICSKEPNKKANGNKSNIINLRMEEMFEEMTKVYK